MLLLYLKAFHIIGVIVWFAGLFYLGRLFVYHCEADQEPEPNRGLLKAQFALMEKRLYYGITWPGLCISVVFGMAMLFKWGTPPWIQLKIGLVLLLVFYHLFCGHLREKLVQGNCNWSGKQFRIFNEIPTVLLISIVFLVIFKEAFTLKMFLLIFMVITLVIVASIFLLERWRKKNTLQNK